MLEAILAVAMPFVVKFTTGYAKQISGIVTSGYRVALIRGVVALLSLVGALLTQAIGEGEIDPGMVETTVFTLINAGVATWLYLAQKNKTS